MFLKFFNLEILIFLMPEKIKGTFIPPVTVITKSKYCKVGVLIFLSRISSRNDKKAR